MENSIAVIHGKRKTLRKTISTFLEKILSWLVVHNWYVIGGAALILAIFKTFLSVPNNISVPDPYNTIELVIYIVFLALVGVLISFLKKANADQMHTMEILNYKHNISLALTKQEDWEVLTSEITKVPSVIASVKTSRLLIYNSILDKWETVAFWNEGRKEKRDFYHDCLKCTKGWSEGNFHFSPCQNGSEGLGKEERYREYCLPLDYGNRLLALVQFRLNHREKLSERQIEIFDSIRYEMASALKSSQDHKRISEMRMTEITLAERRSFLTYLHDNLSQNLAFLCLKLDHFLTEDEQFSALRKRADLEHMKDAANQSYEIVRGMIEKDHPETTPHFVNLIGAYAKKVSQRAHINISVDKRGKELQVSPEVQQDIFYIFQEILSNVEKHAKAEKVNVLLDWSNNSLSLKVSDNGTGFNPKIVDRTKHFGLEIMRERVEKIEGSLDVNSSEKFGTEVTLSIPVMVAQE